MPSKEIVTKKNTIFLKFAFPLNLTVIVLIILLNNFYQQWLIDKTKGLKRKYP